MKTAKLILLFLFVIGFYSFLSSKIESIGNLLLIKEANFESFETGKRYGDMYRFARVSYFNELIPYPEPRLNENNFDSSEFVIIGDSFFESVIEGERMAVNIERVLNRKTYDAMLDDKLSVEYPLSFIKSKKFNNKKRRIMILESAERYAPVRATKLFSNKEYNIVYSNTKKNIKNIFSFNEVDTWMRLNICTQAIMEFKSDLVFNAFNKISENTPKYSLYPNFLFYKEEVDFSNNNYSPEQIEMITGEIKKLSDELKNEYNILLLYVICPNKYSLYGKYTDSTYRYNEFIPKIANSLTNKNVFTINTYDCYLKNLNDIYYYSNDTHFNKKGRDLMTIEIIKKINNIYLSDKK